MGDDGYIAAKKHFESAPDSVSLDHFFEQLDLDLSWALSAAETFRDRDGQPPSLALLKGISAIAGRRYHRFKVSEADPNDKEVAAEMKAFAQFWYLLARKIEELGSD